MLLPAFAQNGDTIIIGNQHHKQHHGCHCAHYTPVHEPVHYEHGHHGLEHHGHGLGHDGLFRRKRSIIRIITVPAQPVVAVKAEAIQSKQ